MKNKEVFIAAIVLGCFLAFFVYLKLKKVKIDSNNIGGCSGTRYGCCRNSRKACADKKCSNCDTIVRHL